MALSISLNISGKDEVMKKLRNVDKGKLNLSVSMKKIGLALAEYYAGTSFVSQGGVFGNQWPALNPEYAEWKADTYPGRGILQREGDLQKSFYYEASKTRVFIGNKDFKFPFHQSTAPRKRLPRRQMIGSNSFLEEIVRGYVYKDIANIIKKA